MTELTHMRLLIIDDDVAGAELLEHVLAQAGYANVLSTGDPIGASQLCATETPDLVLLDLDMPRLSAYQVIEEIRYLIGEPESLPVLVLTADAPDARDRALSMAEAAGSVVRRAGDCPTSEEIERGRKLGHVKRRDEPFYWSLFDDPII